MMMKPRHKRIVLIAAGLAVLGLAAALVLNAFRSNLVFFYTPTQVAAHEAPQARNFRIGGLVEKGSVKRQPDGVTVRFVVTDTAKSVPVTFKLSRKASSAPTAFSPLPKCWPSTTKTTCRRKLRTRSNAQTRRCMNRRRLW
jgi:CcmE